jgi:hypothetical protein
MKLEIIYASRRLGLRYRVVNHIGQFIGEYDTYDAAMHYVNVKTGVVDCHRHQCICTRG